MNLVSVNVLQAESVLECKAYTYKYLYQMLDTFDLLYEQINTIEPEGKAECLKLAPPMFRMWNQYHNMTKNFESATEDLENYVCIVESSWNECFVPHFEKMNREHQMQ